MCARCTVTSGSVDLHLTESALPRDQERPGAGDLAAARNHQEDSWRGGDVKQNARLISLVSILVVGLAAWIVWEIPAMRTLLRQSFTRMPDHYTELYFFSPPSVESGIVTVPIALVEHGDDSALRLRILVRDGSGRATAQTTTAVQPRPDVPVTLLVHLPNAPDQGQVQVELLDHPQTLLYRIGSRAA